MILDTIAEATRIRVEKAKKILPPEQLKRLLQARQEESDFPRRSDFSFEQAFGKQLSFLCEVKKASPSKGVIAQEFPYLSIAQEYEVAGATAISVLTEPDYFQGSNQYLQEISRTVNLPILRKDFTIDEYQIYEAKLLGADAVLLICALLDTATIRECLRLCDQLGLSALVEAHDEAEVNSAIEAGARMIGVNNRNLKTFEVDLGNAVRLRKLVPEHIIFIAESGIQTPEDIKRLSAAGVNGVLIGETLMRSVDKKEQLARLREASMMN